MRRAAAAGLIVAALAAGCGGGSNGSANRSVSVPGGPAPVANGPGGATVGRLGPALVARPGHTKVTGNPRPLNARDAQRAAARAKRALGAEANCQDATVQPTPDNLAHVADVIFCLMNAMRENNGLPDLRRQDQLAQASVEHSQDMVANHYFAHDSLDGRDVVARLRAAGYIQSDADWVVGENLAWGSGSLSTPTSLVNAWMNSPPHRENLLASDYREVGMGVVYGTPDQDAPDGITVTTDFGIRHGGTATVARKSSAKTATHARRRARIPRRCRHRHGAARRRCIRAARHHRR
jgi:uncharacterized protein YkwD